MASPDVRFEACGRSWTFRFGFAAWCSVEQQFDKPFMEVFARCFPELAMGDLLDEEQLLAAKFQARVMDMRAIVYAGLVHHQRDITFRQVDDIVDEIGMEMVGRLCQESLTASQGGGGTATGNPPAPGPNG